MGTLSSALNYAVSGLTAASAQSATASRNVAFAQDINYSRKSAELISLPGGGASVAPLVRSADTLLLGKLLGATSVAAGQQVTLEALSALAEMVGDPENDASLAALVGRLQSTIRSFEADPGNALSAAAVVHDAKGLAEALNSCCRTVQEVRERSDSAIVESVGKIRALLDQFKVVNDAVVRGSGTASDLTESLDERDRILKSLSDELGIRTMARANNDVAIYTESGVTLFETVPREISFTPSPVLTAAVAGGSISVDGVTIIGKPSRMPAASGKLPALAAVRDDVAMTIQHQIDEIARSLVNLFAESDQTSLGGPAIPGLFIDGSSPAVPSPGAQSLGLAGRISVNPLGDPEQGGSAFLLRDGGFGGPAYVYNSTSAAGFQQRLSAIQAGFDQLLTFDPAAALEGSASLKDFCANSAGWIESRRQAAQSAQSSSQALKVRSQEALLRVTGVNIDEEMATILDLEKSYQASARVLTTVNAMLASLMNAVG